MVLPNLIPGPQINCLIIGDFNLCSRKAADHSFLEIIRQKGFRCLLTEATHIDGGALDQAWLRTATDALHLSSAVITSKYYTAKDHDAILFTLYKEEEKSKPIS